METDQHIPPQDRVLNWRPRPDTRSLNFMIADLAPAFSTKEPRSRAWTRKSWLDQGREGACTGFGLAHTIATTPRSTEMTNEMGQQFYYEARRLDEWPGEGYEGSSVLGAMKAGKAMGWLSAYWWASSLAEIISGVSHYGPMEIGVDWYTGMFAPDANGFVHPSGQIEGGHALSLAAVNIVGQFFRLDNSWGPDWGRNGSAFIHFHDIEQLLAQRGEFALPRKVRHV
jgi:hypothetical protein